MRFQHEDEPSLAAGAGAPAPVLAFPALARPSAPGAAAADHAGAHGSGAWRRLKAGAAGAWASRRPRS